jgi:hypothetical protein
VRIQPARPHSAVMFWRIPETRPWDQAVEAAFEAA